MNVVEQAKGRWPGILAAFGEDEILKGKNMPCPFCGGKDRFRFTNYQDKGYVFCAHCMPRGADGFAYLQRRTGESFKSIARKVDDLIGRQAIKVTKRPKDAQAKRKLQSIWDKSVTVKDGCPVSKYLMRRCGILPNTADVRFHPALEYWDENDEMGYDLLGRYPAMVSKIRNAEGWPATLHCTYLTDNGYKADVPKPKKMKTPTISWRGGGITLLDRGFASGVLVYGEGVETVLSYARNYDGVVSAVAAVDAGNLKRMAPPSRGNDLYNIIIAGDNDSSFTGQESAYILAKNLRMQGHTVKVDIPENVGDWCDYFGES